MKLCLTILSQHQFVKKKKENFVLKYGVKNDSADFSPFESPLRRVQERRAGKDSPSFPAKKIDFFLFR